MKQEELKELLEEAAKPECSCQRRTEIQCLLKGAVYQEEEGIKEGIELVLDSLYTDTIRNRPELLRNLFPAFAVMCGERPNGMRVLTKVDWKLMTTN